MAFYHEFRVKSGIDLCMIHGFPAGFIDGVHSDFIQLITVYPRFSGDTAGNRITSGDGTVVEKQNFSVFFKAEFFAPVNRHIRNNRSRRIFSQFVSFF